MTATYNFLLALVGAAVCLLVTLSSAAPTAGIQAQGGQISAGSPIIGELERVRRESPDKKKDKSKDKNRTKDRKAARECLAVHNKYRKMHGVPELKWDQKIAEFAQKRSDHIARSDGAEFGHPPDLPFGENLFWHSSSDTACELMVKGWYDEINLYNFKAPVFEAATGHFTQLIWKQTERVGCALAHSSGKRGGVYLTCNYDPPGNFLGEFETNVPPAVGASPSVARAVTSVTSTTQRPTTALVTSTSSTTTSSTTTTSTTSAPTTKPKKKGKKKNKKKKAEAEGDKEKEQKKKNKKKGNKKKKNKNKNKNKKKTSTTTTTTSTVKPSTR